jgi:hypothetical protein
MAIKEPPARAKRASISFDRPRCRHCKKELSFHTVIVDDDGSRWRVEDCEMCDRGVIVRDEVPGAGED